MHLDAWTSENMKLIQCKKQRHYTVMCFLNDVPEGGETNFPCVNVKIEAKEGRLLFWENCLKDSDEPNEKSKHEGMEITSGEKYILLIWFEK